MQVSSTSASGFLRSGFAVTSGGAGAAATSVPSPFGPAAFLTLSGSVYTPPAATAAADLLDAATILEAGRGATVPTIARSPEQRKAEAAAVEQALSLVDAGQSNEARALLNAVLADNRTNAAAVHALGYAALKDRDYARAEQLFTRAHALNPTVGYDRDAQNARILQGDDQAVFNRARAMVASPQQRKDGQRLLVALTERAPDNAAAHVLLGDTLLLTNDPINGLLQYDAALRTADESQLRGLENKLAELVRKQPKSSYAQRLLGVAQLKQGRFEDAIQTLTRAAALNPSPLAFNSDLAEAYVGAGRVQLARGDLTGALSRFEEARTLAPTLSAVRLALAEGYIARGTQQAQRRQYAAALNDFTQAAPLLRGSDGRKLRATLADQVYDVGRALEQRRQASGGEIDAEVRAFQTAFDLAPQKATYRQKLAEARTALGEQYEVAGKLESAAYAFRRAQELFPRRDAYRDRAVNAFLAWGDERSAAYALSDAVTAYRAAYDLHTDNTTARTKLAEAYIRRGLDYKEQSEFRRAARDFREALKLFPRNETYQAHYNSVAAWER